MNKVAVVEVYGGGYDECSGDVQDAIMRSITEWQEVSDEDLKALEKSIGKFGGWPRRFILIREVEREAKKQVSFAEILAFARAQEEQEAEARKKAEARAARSEATRKKREKERKLRQLEKLQKELGVKGPVAVEKVGKKSSKK